METKQIAWNTGSGNITLTYQGQGDGTIAVQSDPNTLYEARAAQIIVRTTDGSNIERTITIQQAAKVRIDISTAIVTASTQTYSGSALTPTPTVTLNGEAIPSSGYDVAYSNNTNAGTATITIAGKGDYTGTATGTFTINKANPTYTAPTARTGLTYSGSSQYLITAGSTSHGTIQYSSNGTTWSTTRPSSTNAGSYTTYWKLVGDSNHNDVANTSLSTTIAKASRTLSFADTYVVLNTSSNVTKTATPSAGNGDGTITYSISSTTYATINSSSGKVTSKTSDGSAVVTATIAEGTNYLSASASYNLYVFATTHDYSYSGSANNVTLPPGTYKLECWGAQGGSNGANSTYGITAKDGGKGGYSVGQLSIANALAIQVLVGGQGSASAAGYNGGGSTTGTSQYNGGDTFGYSKMGGGGGATDIRLSDGALLSRMIVAGGGSGGAMTYRAETTWKLIYTKNVTSEYQSSNNRTITTPRELDFPTGKENARLKVELTNLPVSSAKIEFTLTTSGYRYPSYNYGSPFNFVSYNYTGARIYVFWSGNIPLSGTQTLNVYEAEVTEDTYSQIGYYGGGINGGAAYKDFKATQNSAGQGGSFGLGAEQTNRYSRHASGAGGAGWYGGGAGATDAYISSVNYMGGGSGFVNTAANAQYRPSGYTGLQLDSGTTYAGNTSFPSTSGGTETGHSGNGYARITRLS